MTKVSIKPAFGWNTQDAFILGISMGSLNHEGSSLAAIVQKINQRGFRGGLIDLSDTLNRYTYRAIEGLSETAAADKARKDGDQWLSRNRNILAQLRMSAPVRRWDEWLNHPGYPAMRATFQKLYDNSVLLRTAIDNDVHRFYRRRYGLTTMDDGSKCLSRMYYLEELAVQSVIASEKPATFLYPGKQLDCFKVIRDGLIEGAPSGLANSTYTRLVLHSFDTKKQDRPAPPSRTLALV